MTKVGLEVDVNKDATGPVEVSMSHGAYAENRKRDGTRDYVVPG